MANVLFLVVYPDWREAFGVGAGTGRLPLGWAREGGAAETRPPNHVALPLVPCSHWSLSTCERTGRIGVSLDAQVYVYDPPPPGSAAEPPELAYSFQSPGGTPTGLFLDDPLVGLRSADRVTLLAIPTCRVAPVRSSPAPGGESGPAAVPSTEDCIRRRLYLGKYARTRAPKAPAEATRCSPQSAAVPAPETSWRLIVDREATSAVRLNDGSVPAAALARDGVLWPRDCAPDTALDDSDGGRAPGALLAVAGDGDGASAVDRHIAGEAGTDATPSNAPVLRSLRGLRTLLSGALPDTQRPAPTVGDGDGGDSPRDDARPSSSPPPPAQPSAVPQGAPEGWERDPLHAAVPPVGQWRSCGSAALPGLRYNRAAGVGPCDGWAALCVWRFTAEPGECVVALMRGPDASPRAAEATVGASRQRDHPPPRTLLVATRRRIVPCDVAWTPGGALDGAGASAFRLNHPLWGASNECSESLLPVRRVGQSCLLPSPLRIATCCSGLVVAVCARETQLWRVWTAEAEEAAVEVSMGPHAVTAARHCRALPAAVAAAPALMAQGPTPSALRSVAPSAAVRCRSVLLPGNSRP